MEEHRRQAGARSARRPTPPSEAPRRAPGRRRPPRPTDRRWRGDPAGRSAGPARKRTICSRSSGVSAWTCSPARTVSVAHAAPPVVPESSGRGTSGMSASASARRAAPPRSGSLVWPTRLTRSSAGEPSASSSRASADPSPLGRTPVASAVAPAADATSSMTRFGRSPPEPARPRRRPAPPTGSGAGGCPGARPAAIGGARRGGGCLGPGPQVHDRGLTPHRECDRAERRPLVARQLAP